MLADMRGALQQGEDLFANILHKRKGENFPSFQPYTFLRVSRILSVKCRETYVNIAYITE